MHDDAAGLANRRRGWRIATIWCEPAAVVAPAESRGFAHQHRSGRRRRVWGGARWPTGIHQQQANLPSSEKQELPLAPKAASHAARWEGRHGRTVVRPACLESQAASDGSRRVMSKTATRAGTEIVTVPGPAGTVRPDRPRVIGLSAVGGCARQGSGLRRHRSFNRPLSPTSVSIRTHAYGVRCSRALSSLLSLDAPNAQWPAASLVLAPILNLRGRSR